MKVRKNGFLMVGRSEQSGYTMSQCCVHTQPKGSQLYVECLYINKVEAQRQEQKIFKERPPTFYMHRVEMLGLKRQQIMESPCC